MGAAYGSATTKEPWKPDFLDRFFDTSVPHSREIDLSELPVTHNERPSKPALGAIIAGSFLLSVPLVVAPLFLQALQRRFDLLEFGVLVGPVCFFIVGVVLLLCGLLALRRRISIVIDRDYVTVRHERPSGSHEWSEPFSGYAGIAFRAIKPNHRADPTYSVELRHPTPEHSVVLFASKDGVEAAYRWRPACHALGMPPCEVVGRLVRRLDESHLPPLRNESDRTAVASEDPFGRGESGRRSALMSNAAERHEFIRKYGAFIGLLIIELMFLGVAIFCVSAVIMNWGTEQHEPSLLIPGIVCAVVALVYPVWHVESERRREERLNRVRDLNDSLGPLPALESPGQEE